MSAFQTPHVAGIRPPSRALGAGIALVMLALVAGGFLWLLGSRNPYTPAAKNARNPRIARGNAPRDTRRPDTDEGVSANTASLQSRRRG